MKDMDTCSRCSVSGVPEGAVVCEFCDKRFDSKRNRGLSIVAMVLGLVGLGLGAVFL